MDLSQQFELVKKKKKYISNSGTVDIVFEIHANNEKDASGNIPVCIKPTIEEKKIKRSLN